MLNVKEDAMEFDVFWVYSWCKKDFLGVCMVGFGNLIKVGR